MTHGEEGPKSRQWRVGAAVALCVTGTVAAVGVGVVLSHHSSPPVGRTLVASTHQALVTPTKPLKYCGTPRPTKPEVADPQASEPPNQPRLDAAAQWVDSMSGGGKSVTRGWSKPGRFSSVFTGLAIDSEWNTLKVYRKPDDAFDRAVCRGVHGVTVEFHDTTVSATEQSALSERLAQLMRPGKTQGFRIFSISSEPDGSVKVGVDNVAAAKKALASYGPAVSVVKGAQAHLA